MPGCPSSSKTDPSAALARSHVWINRRDDVLAVLDCYYREGVSLTVAIHTVCSKRKCSTLSRDSVGRIGEALAPGGRRHEMSSAPGKCGFSPDDRAARLAALDKWREPSKAGAEKSGAGRKGRR